MARKYVRLIRLVDLGQINLARLLKLQGGVQLLSEE